MKMIDLYSDTKTLPTEEMRQAMYEAELGDDVAGEDPTVNRLEELAAKMLGKDSALFTPSGIMSNLLAVLTQTRPGQEILLGNESHMFWYEVGGASTLGGVIMRTVRNEPDGRIEPHIVAESIRPENIHFPSTTLLCLENTHNRCGGTILTPEYTTTISELAHKNGLLVHLDGARIFSAAVALNISVKELVGNVDSICFCLSKNLSAPVGSLLCGSREFVEKARKWRRMVGGGMRQAGVIAAAGIVALEKMIDRLEEDHANAKHLAYGLANIPGFIIHPEKVQTNIVIFKPPRNIPVLQFVEQMTERGVRFSILDEDKVRAITHRMVSTADIDDALGYISTFIKSNN
ncbi:MAG: aminotransferase class I/II-fold pyridoxal phosphate-dependent enzyme [Dehalococcoidia bacterium]|nr:MAG: aminotransferase class I/II-fold pyridoxal phosphate-dependent enzyme [Dehalococcoidia bacterium]